MSEGIKRLPLAEAKKVAEELVEEMHPYCDRIAIAGSIRREKSSSTILKLLRSQNTKSGR